MQWDFWTAAKCHDDDVRSANCSRQAGGAGRHPSEPNWARRSLVPTRTAPLNQQRNETNRTSGCEPYCIMSSALVTFLFGVSLKIAEWHAHYQKDNKSMSLNIIGWELTESLWTKAQDCSRQDEATENLLISLCEQVKHDQYAAVCRRNLNMLCVSVGTDCYWIHLFGQPNQSDSLA